jgi:hypothetical protein
MEYVSGKVLLGANIANQKVLNYSAYICNDILGTLCIILLHHYMNHYHSRYETIMFG